jgi:AcrR family transcriptional regulator
MTRRPQFDAASLCEAGLAVVRREGWPAVSVRSVADELGVSPMALYRLVADAGELRRRIADAAAVTGPQPRHDLPLPDALRTWAVGAHRHLVRHRGLASFVLVHWTELPAWLDVVEHLLSVAHDDGLDGPAAVASVNAVFAYVLARAQVHDALAGGPRRQLAPVRAEPGRYPHVWANRPEFARARTERHFLVGLAALVAGLSLR